MNLLEQIQERKSKALSFLQENSDPNVENEIKIIFNDAEVSEIKELAQQFGLDNLRYEKVLRRWFYCKTEFVNVGLLTVCVWSKHVTKEPVTSDILEEIFAIH